ncbi:molybdopterin-dependent oxidoreductase [Mucilaginibacter daejeonensis]|uniref:molybdopterin-dependent oxidoreductase n=1 Tax=Mucilaginibacter daejeonensis TaxID=398049 RepID=UPI001D17D0D4|nr:molybdopterin-dependent oxidoreductase [Mucilaginibacter daejeonensis]UEG53583.1 molybdopterin-dependent oxidoreductase [Mucilaginibacter daejeonensis]
MNKFLLAFALLTCIGMQLQAQTITISGDGIAVPVLITKSMLAEPRQAVVMAKAHDEKVHRYSGVPVANLLAKAGLLLGDTAKRATIKTYVVITAADNYKVIFALPEIDPLFANRTIILADRADKKALPAEDGPFQIIVPGEKKHARWIRQVTSIQVVKLNI